MDDNKLPSHQEVLQSILISRLRSFNLQFVTLVLCVFSTSKQSISHYLIPYDTRMNYESNRTTERSISMWLVKSSIKVKSTLNLKKNALLVFPRTCVQNLAFQSILNSSTAVSDTRFDATNHPRVFILQKMTGERWK